MTSASKPAGFTLIELLVVMTIAMTLVALVGGLGVNAFQQYNRLKEEKTLKAALAQVMRTAYLKEREYIVNIDNSRLSVSTEASGSETLAGFEYLQINPSPLAFKVNAAGIPEYNVLHYRIGNANKSLSLHGLLGVE